MALSLFGSTVKLILVFAYGVSNIVMSRLKFNCDIIDFCDGNVHAFLCHVDVCNKQLRSSGERFTPILDRSKDSENNCSKANIALSHWLDGQNKLCLSTCPGIGDSIYDHKKVKRRIKASRRITV